MRNATLDSEIKCGPVSTSLAARDDVRNLIHQKMFTRKMGRETKLKRGVVPDEAGGVENGDFQR